MNMTQKITYQVDLTKDELSLVTKALTQVLKERDTEDAIKLGQRLLSEVNSLSEGRLRITEGALKRAKEKTET